MDHRHLNALREQRRQVVAEIERNKAILQQIDDHFAEVLGAGMREMMSTSGKQSGEITWTLEDGSRYKGSVSKTVKYDSDKLQRIASSMPWDKAQNVFKIELSVPEATYQDIRKLDPALAREIEEARTVRYGDIKVTPIE